MSRTWSTLIGADYGVEYAAGNSYEHLFGGGRARLPRDKTLGGTLSCPSVIADEASATTRVTFFDVTQMAATVGGKVLDLAYVRRILHTTGPVNRQPSDNVMWDWRFPLSHLSASIRSEQDYYPWLHWQLFDPAAHAAGAVRDRFYEQELRASIPEDRKGVSKAVIINHQHPRGVTDILHKLETQAAPGDSDSDSDSGGAASKIAGACTAHEVKRARVLQTPGGVGVLEQLVGWAQVAGGYNFQIGAGPAQDKARRLLFQAIDELVLYRITHIVLTTEEQYVLLRLDADQQLQISKLYNIESYTPVEDMTELVLFYSNAMVNPGRGYRANSRATTAFRVSIPAFPAQIFRPYEARFRNGALTHRAKLSPVDESAALLPAFSLRFDAESGLDRPDADVEISFGKLVFGFLQARVVAKTANTRYASERLRHEFAAYKLMGSAGAGASIPALVGLYVTPDDGRSVLIVSHAGTTLDTFAELTFAQRRTLLLHLVRLHKGGVKHNDIEPRNVVISSASAPIIIDFDLASLDHVCQGRSCTELTDVAQRLQVDLDEVCVEAAATSATALLRVGFWVCLAVLAVWRTRT